MGAGEGRAGTRARGDLPVRLHAACSEAAMKKLWTRATVWRRCGGEVRGRRCLPYQTASASPAARLDCPLPDYPLAAPRT